MHNLQKATSAFSEIVAFGRYMPKKKMTLFNSSFKTTKIISSEQKLSRKNQKQLSRAILTKRCSENMQQIYRRTLMPKCGFSENALQLYWNHTSAWIFSFTLLHIFGTLFLKNTFGGLLLKNVVSFCSSSILLANVLAMKVNMSLHIE